MLADASSFATKVRLWSEGPSGLAPTARSRGYQSTSMLFWPT